MHVSLFLQLAREAIQVRSQIPHMVVGNQIFSNVSQDALSVIFVRVFWQEGRIVEFQMRWSFLQLYPGIQLVIALCFNTDKDKKASFL